MNPRTDILDVTPEEFSRRLQRMGERPYRSRQILEWVYKKGATDFEKMTNLPRDLRQNLSEKFRIGSGEVEKVSRSGDDRKAKYGFRLLDDARIEAVSMPDGRRHTACISSQVGCGMACRFCATGTMGFARDLTCGEMILQPLEIARRDGKVTNIVFMGMGEPLLNLPNVLRAIDALTDAARFGLGGRRITISTSGIIPGIDELAHSPVSVRLALSLNSPYQEQRARLMPIAKKYPLPKVLDACSRYSEVTGRRVSIEYVLLGGVNTGRAAADALAKIALGLSCKVNLIQYNPVPGLPFSAPSTRDTLRFREWLENSGVRVIIRFRKGRDIKAACGQLAVAQCKMRSENCRM